MSTITEAARTFGALPETSPEVAQALLNFASKTYEGELNGHASLLAEMIWEEPEESEIATVMAEERAMTAPSTDALQWGLTTFRYGGTVA